MSEYQPCGSCGRTHPYEYCDDAEPVSDWRNAQVIEATTVYGRQILPRRGKEIGELDLIWQGVGAKGIGTYWFGSSALSDVRVIVDAEGKVVPPEITDEMVERAAKAAFNAFGYTHWDSIQEADREDHRIGARAALTAALGADHG